MADALLVSPVAAVADAVLDDLDEPHAASPIVATAATASATRKRSHFLNPPPECLIYLPLLLCGLSEASENDVDLRERRRMSNQVKTTSAVLHGTRGNGRALICDPVSVGHVRRWSPRSGRSPRRGSAGRRRWRRAR